MSSERIQVIERTSVLGRFLKSQVCEHIFRGLLLFLVIVHLS